MSICTQVFDGNSRKRSASRAALVMIAMMTWWGGCSDFGVTPGGDMIVSTGRIEQDYGIDFLLRSDREFQGSTIFYPQNLPDSFRHNGLRVKFAGNIAMDPTVMYILPPIRLISIDLIPGSPRPD